MSQYSPEYIGTLVEYASGDTVTADEFNTILNKLITQGDHNSEWLHYLDTIGIPAAVAAATVGDIQTYIATQVQAQIAAITAGAVSKTTGYTTKKKLCLISANVSSPAIASKNISFCTSANLITSSVSEPNGLIFNGYDGSDITQMTSDTREAACTSVRTTMHTYGTDNNGTFIYQNHSGTVSPSYLTGNCTGYLYTVSTPKTYKTVQTEQRSYPMQFPVVNCNNLSALATLTSSATVDDFLIVNVPIPVGTTWTALQTYLNGFEIADIHDYIDEFLRSFGCGREVYMSYNENGRSLTYNNKLTAIRSLCIDTSNGVVKINPSDLMKSSTDKLTFTVTGNNIVAVDAAGNTVLTYTPTQLTVNDTLVGNTSAPNNSSGYLVTVNSYSNVADNSVASKANSKVKAGVDSSGNGYMQIDSHNVPYVVSYNADTGLLVLGGF